MSREPPAMVRKAVSARSNFVLACRTIGGQSVDGSPILARMLSDVNIVLL